MSRSGDQPLAFVGLSGTGKSTIAPMVAAELGLDHHDIDRMVEAAEGLTIQEVFASAGEAAFRSMEARALATVLDDPCVISTGGGIVVSESARAFLRDRTFTVWLDAPPAILVARLMAGLAEEPRPLLGDGSEPGAAEKALQVLAEQRQGWYTEVSDHRIDVSEMSPAEVVDEVLEKLR